MVKPDEKIFKLSMSRLQVLPEEAIFIDDISLYVCAAQNLGIKTILYNNFGQMKAELARLLASANSNN
jgi:putative hydrolase of the HAD superfamily